MSRKRRQISFAFPIDDGAWWRNSLAWAGETQVRGVMASLPKLPTRTSQSDPIRVDWLDGIAGTGRIGLTFAPGKVGAAMFGGDWNRDLDADLDRLVKVYQVDVLICLVEHWELFQWQIEALFTEAGDRGMTPYWEPVVDGLPPSHAQADRVVRIALEAVAQGKRVIIHCRGGRGRAGTLGACCYVAQGYGPQTAIVLTRAYRQGAVETLAQEDFIVRFAKRLRRLQLEAKNRNVCS